MPRGDGTGPSGRGPLTGRGMGSCKPGRAFDYRRGNNLGCGYSNDYNLSREDEKTYLKEQEVMLKSQLNDLRKRLDEIE